MSAKLVSTPAQRIQYLMEKQGLKQTDLARMTGIDKSSISLYLSGKYKPKGDKVHLIAKALNTDPAFIMGFDSEEKVIMLIKHLIYQVQEVYYGKYFRCF